MKMLLTSAGFTNNKIVKGLEELTKKPLEKLKLVFIPTAANVEKGGKEWLIEDLNNCKKLNFSQIDIVDISAVPKEIWLPRLEESNILFFGGGNTYHLISWVEKSGLKEILPDLLKTRIYVGLSAGSMIVSKWWSGKYERFFYEESDGLDTFPCLGYVDFHIMPHLNLGMFPKVTTKNIKNLTSEIPGTIYALDDNSAVKVDNGEIEIISNGSWKKFN